MSILQTLGQGQGYLKAGFQGFGGSGKTYTATLLAIAVRNKFGLKGPIALFDSESGSEYVAPMIREATGQNPAGLRSRSFDDLVNVTIACEAEGVSVLVVDSITHVWRDLCECYLAEINDTRRQRNLPSRTSLEFQDWGIVKGTWNNEWARLYLNSKLHIIICGRGGYEWDMARNEETGRNELVKTGTKMKTEGEFGFEPSLSVEMEQVQNLRENTVQSLRSHKPKPSVSVVSAATIKKDRFGVIHGACTNFTTFPASDKKKLEKELKAVEQFFGPHLDLLVADAHAPIDMNHKTQFGVDESGDAAWYREKRDRKILCEEIQGEIVRLYPGQTAAEKKAKADLVDECFKTRSWTRVEEVMPLTALRTGLSIIREKVALAQLAGVVPLNGGGADES